MDNEENEVVERLRMSRMEEQLEAATEQARDIFHKASVNIPHQPAEVRVKSFDVNTYMSTPVLKKLRWMIDRQEFDKLEFCPHIDFDNPTVWCVFVGQSDFLGCSDCVQALEKASAEYNSDECDSCKKRGISIFHEYFANIGSVLIHGSLCETCINLQRQGESC